MDGRQLQVSRHHIRNISAASDSSVPVGSGVEDHPVQGALLNEGKEQALKETEAIRDLQGAGYEILRQEIEGQPRELVVIADEEATVDIAEENQMRKDKAKQLFDDHFTDCVAQFDAKVALMRTQMQTHMCEMARDFFNNGGNSNSAPAAKSARARFDDGGSDGSANMDDEDDEGAFYGL